MPRKTIEYQGVFDVSNIISGLKQIRAEMDKNVSDSGKGALGGIDKQLAALQKQSSSLFAALEKGFSSTSEAKAFEKEVGKLHQNLLQVKNNLQGIARTEISTNTKEYQKQIAQVERQIKQLKNNALNDLIKTLKTSKLNGKENLEMLAREGKLTKDVIQSEIDKRAESIKQQKEELEIIKEKAKQEALNNAATKAVGRKGLGTLVNDENLANNFKYNSNTYKNYNNSIRARNDKGNYVQKFTPGAGAVINEEYRKALVDAVNTGKTGTEAFNAFAAAMTRYNITITNSKEIWNRMEQQLANSNKVYGESVDKINNLNVSELKEVQTAEKNIEKIEQERQAYQILNGAIDTYNGKMAEADSKMDNFTSSATQTNNALEGLSSQADGIGENIFDWAEGANTAAEELSNTTEQQQKLNSVFDGLKGRIGMLLSIGNIFYKIRSEVIKTYNDVRLLDQAFGQIAMVTDFSIEDMWGKYDAYAKIANELGQSTLSVVQASGLYFQQGLEEAEALELTTSTMKLATLAGLDFEQATSLMTSAVRGFHMEMSEGEHVTDVYSELAAHAAASVDQIATAMSRTAAIANSAGMEFETTSAMLTTMIEATQESPETLGTAMKTVVARFTELKNNVSELDSEFDDLDYNKVDKALKSIGVSLKDTNGQFRDIDDVFLEVAEKWDTLDRNSQRYVATIAAGSRQQSRFISLMENYDRTLELIDVAQNSAGKSSEQFAKYQDTLENKVNRLKNSWEQLKLSFLDSDIFKGAVDGINKLITDIGKMDKRKLVAIGLIGVTIGKSLIQNIISSLQSGADATRTAVSSALNGIFGKTGILIKSRIKVEESSIKEAKDKLSEIYREINSFGDQYVSAAPKLKSFFSELSISISKLQQEGKQVNLDELIKDLTEGKNLTRDELLEIESLIPKIKEMAQAGESFTDAIKKSEDRIKLLQNKFEKIGKTAGTAFSTAFTTTATAVLTTNDPMEVVTANVTTFAMTTIPTAMSQIVSAVVGGLKTIELEEAAATLGISLLVQAVVTAAGVGIVQLKNYLADQKEAAKLANDSVYALQKRIDQLTEAQEEYNEALAESSQLYDEEKERWEKIEKASTTYEELSKKVFLTDEEQEELNDATNTLAEMMPNLVSGYDSQHNAILNINDAYYDQIKLQKESYLQAKKAFLLDQQRAKINEINQKKAELEQKEEEKKTKENALKTKKQINIQTASEKGIMGYLEYGAGFNPIAYLSLAPFAGIAKVGIDSAQGDYSSERTLESILKGQFGYETSYLKDFAEDTVIGSDILRIANEKFKKNGEDFKNAQDALKSIGKSKTQTESFFNELLSYYKDTENYADEIALEEGKLKAELSNYSNEQINLMYDSLTTELELANPETYAKMTDEQKQLINDMISATIFTREDVQKEVDDIINSSEDTDIIFNQLQTYFSSFFADNKFDNVINEVSKDENLTKVVAGFFDKYLSLSPTELQSKLDSMDVPNTVRTYLQNSIDEVEKGLTETQEKLNSYNIDIPILNVLFSDGKVSADTSNNLGKQLALLESEGEGYAEAYLKGFEKYLSQNKEYSNELINYLMAIDFEQWDYFSSDSNKKEIVKNLVTQGLADSEAAAEEILSNYLDFINTTELKPKIDLEQAIDVNTYADMGTTIAKAFQEQFDNLSDLISIRSDSTTITLDIASKLKTAFEKIAEDTNNKVKINLDDYITGYTEDGQIQLGNLKALNEEIFRYTNLSGILKNKQKELETQESELTEEEQQLLQAIKDTLPELEKLDKETLSQYQYARATEEGLKSLISTIDSLGSTYSSAYEEILKNGNLSLSSVNGFISGLEGLNNEISELKLVNFEVLDVSEFLTKTRNGVSLNTKAFEGYIDTLLATLEASGMYKSELYYILEAMKTQWEETRKATQEANKDAWDTYNEDVQSKYKEWQESLDEIKEKEEAVAEAEKKVKEAEENLLETEEKLQEIYYGSENHKNKNDYLYNFKTELDQIKTKAEEAAEALDNLSPDDDVHQKVEDYKNALADEIANYQAQNEVIKQYIKNQKEMLDNGLSARLEQLKAEGAVDTSTNVSDFYYEQDGRFYIDYTKLNAARLPDDVRDFIEEQVDLMNQYTTQYESNLDEIEKARKDFESRQKAARDRYIEVENKVIDLLKKKDQEELDNLKEKYDGMKEADDDYTNALEESIKKQRELRNQANQWDDLAEKEKKLSLQQRDTSGANAKAIKKQQEDIAKTRESLLDNAVDNIVNNLKELYAEQEETRQAEIEYRQAILDNKNYVDEATAIINNWENAQDALDFFMAMDEEFNNTSEATFNKLVDDVNGYYEDSVYYYEMAGQDFEDVINQANEEANSKIRDTSETLTSESERALDETMKEVHEAQEQGRKDVEEAKKAVEDAKQSVVEATKAVATALEEATKKQIAYNEAIAKQPHSPGGEKIKWDDEEDEEDDDIPVDPKETGWNAKDFVSGRMDFYRKYYEMQKGKIIDDNYNGNYILRAQNQEQLKEILIELSSRGMHALYNENKGKIRLGTNNVEDLPVEERNGYWIQYKSGGLVNYTGPAWVDGTPSKPEAFLSASDTAMLRQYIDFQKFNFSEQAQNILNGFSNLPNTSLGDPIFNIDINVESISSDYDVDQLVERVHEDILSITNEPGSMIMLSK